MKCSHCNRSDGTCGCGKAPYDCHYMKKKIKERKKYLEMEIAHGRYWDGWSLEGMKKELKELVNKVEGKSVEK